MKRLAAAAAIAVALTSCGFVEEQSRQGANLTTTNIELAALKQRVDALEADSARAISTSKLEPVLVAEFDPAADTGFQLVQTAVTPVLVMFKDVEPLADGARARLQIGNLSAAGLEQANIKVSYRARSGGELLTVSQAVLKSMPPGAWTEVQASLPYVKPSDLGYLAVEVQLSTVTLRKAQ